MQAAAAHAAVFVMSDEARPLEYAQMFGHGGKRHAEGLREFTDGRFAPREAREDGAAGRVGQRAKGGVQRRL